MGYAKPTLKTTVTAGAGAAVPPQNGNAPAVNPSTNAWQTPGGTKALKSALVQGRSQAPRKSVMMAVPPTPSDVAAKLGGMQIANPIAPSWRAGPKVYDPSMGPTPSAMTTKFRQTVAPSRLTTRTARQMFQNAVCTLSNYTRRDFCIGDVICAPFHTANTNPNADPQDPNLSKTPVGHAYSKRRMLVVLFIYQQDLHCLPLYSFSGRGPAARPQDQQREYVSLRNVGDKFDKQGVHDPLEMKALHDIDGANTTVHLTGGMKVGCNEHITQVGRLTKKSYFELTEIWRNVVKTAQAEPW